MSRAPSRLLTLAGLLTVVVSLLPPLVASAQPVCPGADKSSCGGRTFPEPMTSVSALTYAETKAGLESLAAEFPDWITMGSVGTSHNGFDLMMVSITAPTGAVAVGDREYVFVSQSIHGNEPGGREGGVRYLEDLVRDVDPARKALLEQVVFVQIFMNPDGWTAGDHDQLPDPSDPDNVAVWKRGNGNGAGASDVGGVDINRSMPWYGWIPDGRVPVSEVESQALVDEVRRRVADGQHLDASTDIHGEVADAAAWVMLSAGSFDLQEMTKQRRQGEAVVAGVEEKVGEAELVTISEALGQTVDAGILTASSEFGSVGSGGSGSGFIGDWIAQSEGGGSHSISTVELFNFDASPGVSSLTFRREIFQIYRDAVAGILGALIDQAAIEHTISVTLPGEVGYVFDPATTTDPVLGGERSTMEFFSELQPYLDRPLHRFEVADLGVAGALDGIDSLVITRDHVLGDVAATAAVHDFVDAGGVLVLTDAGVRVVAAMLDGIDDSQVNATLSNIGPVDFPDRTHPMLVGLRDIAYLMAEPAVLGYQVTGGGDVPNWRIDRAAFEAAGGTTVGTNQSATSVGELPVGNGVVRTIGLLLPPPIATHQVLYGLSSYAPLDTGYSIFLNSLGATVSDAAPAPTPQPDPDPVPTPEPAPSPLPTTGGGAALLGLAMMAAGAVSGRRRR